MALAARLRDGDSDAMNELYRRYSRPLFAIGRSMLADRDRAEDAVQQTLVQAWRAAHTIDPARSLTSWIYTIGRRVCIDLYRRDRRANDALTADGVVSYGAGNVITVEKAWMIAEVRRAVDDLPERERDIVRLSHLLGWSYPEIADHLELPLGTVKSRAFRAHRRLAEVLAEVQDAA
jgi:RNA polymerase sigma-70 factor (ECF subfamily)